MRTTSRPGLLASLLAAVLVLAGCTGLPRSGPVTASDPDLPAAPPISLFASGPQAGASPEQIVEGFLAAASAGFSDDFLVAREFLAGPAADEWRPLERVQVYADSPSPHVERAGDGGVSVTVAAEATVDSGGRYAAAVAGSTLEVGFTLARDADGEWRIVGLEDGVLVAAANFNSVYASSPVYFLTPDGNSLVADLRWFPQQHLITSLVSELLTGPSPALAPGVTSAVPVGTRMPVESVLVSDGVARVDLSGEALAAEGWERSLMHAQIEATLTQIAPVRDVEITVEGAPLELTEPVPELSAYPYASAPLMAVQDGVLVEVAGGETTPHAAAEALAGLDLSHPARGYDAPTPPTVALDGADRLVTVPESGEQSILLAEGTDLVPPSFDRLGWVWTAPASRPETLEAVRVDGTSVAVDVPWLDGGTLRALRLARDGSRAAVLWESGGNVVVDVAAVVRHADGAPASLAEPERVGDELEDASDLAWVEEATVAVLGTSADNPEPAVHLVTVGGPVTTLPAVEGAVSLTAGRGDRSLVLATAEGRLYERNGAAWRPVVSGLSDPALPG